MEHIIEGALRFQREVYPSQEAMFEALAQGQSPAALFIGCSDSRVIPELLTQQGPGELFVVRNAGNIVPPHPTEPGGVTASIEYAVEVLKIPDIIVCGHSGCGAMTAILRTPEQLETLPAVARWLHYADRARQRIEADHADQPEEQRLHALIQQNVLAQLANLVTHPPVARAIAHKRLRLHGWVYDMASGGVSAYDATQASFAPLRDRPRAEATPVEARTAP